MLADQTLPNAATRTMRGSSPLTALVDVTVDEGQDPTAPLLSFCELDVVGESGLQEEVVPDELVVEAPRRSCVLKGSLSHIGRWIERSWLVKRVVGHPVHRPFSRWSREDALVGSWSPGEVTLKSARQVIRVAMRCKDGSQRYRASILRERTAVSHLK